MLYNTTDTICKTLIYALLIKLCKYGLKRVSVYSHNKL